MTPETFRRGMRQLAAGVTIVAAAHHGERRGLTATAVCSLSLEPPMLLACVNRSATAHGIIRAGRCFSVNVLARTDRPLANRFAAPETTGAARFAAGSWTTLKTGAPILQTALASFDCELAREVEVGTHSIFIGVVVAVTVNPGRPPLLYANGSYGGLAGIDPREDAG